MSLLKKTCVRSLLTTSFLLSQDVFSYNETDLFNDIPEISSVSRLPQNLQELPVSTTIISQEMIKASTATDITELFKLVPGFQSYNPNANKHAVSYHGNSGEFPNRLDIRINGRPVYLAMLSTVAWNTLGISIEDIDYIEVVRGSNVPSYGSNALIGAINIVTFQPLDQESHHISATLGSQQTKRVSASFSKRTDDMSVRASLTHDQNNGFDDVNDGKQANMGNVSLTFTPTLFDTINISAGFSHGYIDIGAADDPADEPYNYLPREHHSHYEQLDWQRTLTDNSDIRISVFNNYLKLNSPRIMASEFLGDPGLAGVNGLLQQLAGLYGPAYPFPSQTASDFSVWPAGEKGTAQSSGLELQYTQGFGSSVNMASGIGYRQDTVKSAVYLGQEGAIKEDLFYAFNNVEWQLSPKLYTNFGLMVEDSTIAGTATSIRLGANYQASKAITLRAAATKAYRMPSLLEEMTQVSYQSPEGVVFDYVSMRNTNLAPEKLISTELGLLWALPRYKGYIDIKLYQEKISDGLNSYFTNSDIDLLTIVDGDSNSRVFTVKNASHSYAKGLDLQATVHTTPNDLVHLAYNYNRLTGIKDRGAKKNQTMDERSPRHTLSLLYNHTFTPAINASLVYNYMSDVEWFDSSQVDSFSTFDSQLSFTHPLSHEQVLTTKIIVKNLFNNEYHDFGENNLFDRRLYLTMDLSF